MCLVSLSLPQPMPAPAVLPKIKMMDCALPMQSSLLIPSSSSKTTAPSNLIVSKNCNVYEVGNLIRDGKFGAIHSATVLDLKTPLHRLQVGQDVAVKVCSISKMEQLRAFENPYIEIEILKMIGQGHSSSYLVGLIESFIIGDHMYMIFPLYSDGDLLDLMESRFLGGMPSHLVKKLMMDVLQGVHMLHSRGIIHRDLSIENILFDQERNHFAICDFGMAWHGSSSSGRSHPEPLCGKGGYMAPEQWNGSFDTYPTSKEELTMRLAATDIWSCGVIFFMALTGTAPFQRAVSWDPHYQLIARGRFLELFDFNRLDQESIEILTMIEKIFHLDPSQRPTAHDLLCQLSQQ